MIRIRFIDPITNVVLSDAQPQSCSLKYQLSATTDWSATFPKNLAALQDVVEGVDVEIYYNENNILSGSLQNYSEKWNGQKIDVSLSGRGVLDKLYDTRSYSFGYYENTPRLLILAQLLDKAGWRIGKVDTWTTPTEVSTIDLRSEKRLLGQISTFINGFPSTFFRYGGMLAGKPCIDVGGFNSDSGVAVVRSADLENFADVMEKTGLIQDISRSTTLTEIINSVEVWGGEVQDNAGVARSIFLKDTLAGFPALATDPDFPIITELANYIYRIKNNAVPTTKGGQSVERYPQYAPEKTNTNATATAIQTAAKAMYERGVAFLQDHQDNIDTISVKASGLDLFMDVGDKVYVSATARQAVIDPFSDQISEVLESQIQDFYRCTALTLSFDNNSVNWAFELTNGNLVKEEDIFVSVYDAAANKNQITGSTAIAGYNAPTLAPYTLGVIGGYPDTTLSDGTPARFVTIPVPVTGLPVWTPTKMYSACIPLATGTLDPIVFEVVQDFAYNTTPMILKCAVKNSGWTDSSQFTMNYYVVWSQ